MVAAVAVIVAVTAALRLALPLAIPAVRRRRQTLPRPPWPQLLPQDGQLVADVEPAQILLARQMLLLCIKYRLIKYRLKDRSILKLPVFVKFVSTRTCHRIRMLSPSSSWIAQARAVQSILSPYLSKSIAHCAGNAVLFRATPPASIHRYIATGATPHSKDACRAAKYIARTPWHCKAGFGGLMLMVTRAPRGGPRCQWTS